MLIAGAGGHALEVIDLLIEEQIQEIKLFDETLASEKSILNRFEILHDLDIVTRYFEVDHRFCLGVGEPKLRKYFYNKLTDCGGIHYPLISQKSSISSFSISEQYYDAFAFTNVGPKTSIGFGTLVNLKASVHHESHIGDWCEISPRVCILGNAMVGDFTRIGAGAVVLPNVKIGENCVIGAGAVVTKDVLPNSVVLGVPARPKR